MNKISRFCATILAFGLGIFFITLKPERISAFAAPAPLLYTTLDDAASVASPLNGSGVGSSVNTTPANDFIAGKVANGIRIDAAAEYVRFQETDGTVANVELDKGTVDFWYQPFYANTDGLSHRIFGIGTKNQAGSLGLYKRTSAYGNDLYLIVTDGTGKNRETTVPSSQYTWSANQWVNLRVSWDSTVGVGVQNAHIYINGNEPGYSKSNSGPFTMPGETSTNYIYIGSVSDTETNTANGVLDEFKIYLGAIAPTPSPTPTFTSTAVPTNAPTNTATRTPNTPTNTATATITLTAIATATPTNTPTNTLTYTPTYTAAASGTPTGTPTNTPTDTPSNAPTDTPTFTQTYTPTSTAMATATNTNTAASTATNTPLPTATSTSTNTPLPTNTPTNTSTATPTNTATGTPTPIGIQPLLYTTLDNALAVSSPVKGIGAGSVISTTPTNDFVVGRVGNGIRIDGANEFVSFVETNGTTNNVDLTAGTIDFWYQPFYANTDGISHRIFSIGNRNAAGSIALYKRTATYNNDLYVQVMDAVGGPHVTTVPTTAYGWSANQWVELRITWDSTVATGVASIHVYLNGTEVTAYSTLATGGFTMPLPSTSQTIYIGSISNVETNTATGVLDEFKIYLGAIAPAPVPSPSPTSTPTLTAVPSSPTPDMIPPTVAITFPANGTTLSSSITVTANATDNVGVAGVQFQVDGIGIGQQVTVPPYSMVLDTTTIADGAHALTAVARDTSNNTAVSSAVSVTVNNTNRPNIVLIVSDDQRWDTMQYMPLINSLLGGASVKFDNAFVTTSECCPSRASILTGLYAHNHGVLQNYGTNGGALAFKDGSTIATWLQATGYKTGLYGKYLNAYYLLSPYIPPGWSEFHAFVWPDDDFYYNYTFNDNGVVSTFGSSTQDYSTDVLAAKAVQFINNTPSNQPFFLYFTPYGPHAPATPAQSDQGSYSGLLPWRPASFNEADVSDKPTWVQQLPLLTTTQIATGDAFRQRQLETLQSVDRAVSSIVSALSQTNRMNNTMIIYLSDNSLTWGEHRWLDNKGCVYEECVRVPLWVRLPGGVGRNDSNLVANIDLAPSIAEYAGVPVPSKVNGLSFMGLLNNPQASWRTNLLLEELGGATATNFQAVRTSQYVYAEYQNGDKELYDLQADPLQLNNIANDPNYAAIITQLQTLLAALKNS